MVWIIEESEDEIDLALIGLDVFDLQKELEQSWDTKEGEILITILKWKNVPIK